MQLSITSSSQVILYFIGIFFLYSIVWRRCLRYYYKQWYYKRQGIPSISGVLPLLGTSLKILDIQKKIDPNYYVYFALAEQEFNGNIPPIYLQQVGESSFLFVNKPELVDQLFIQNGKFVHRSSTNSNFFIDLNPRSVLHSTNMRLWKKQRKAFTMSLFH